MRFLAVLVLVVLAACDASTSSPENSCPDGAPCNCKCTPGAQCVCDSFSMPACSPTANTGTSCDNAPGCMGCSQGAGYNCLCSSGVAPGSDGGGGMHWVCIGTEYACTGQTQ